MLSLPISLTDLQIDEVLRYMGTPPDRAEPAIRKLAEECAQELLGVARPRWAARTFEPVSYTHLDVYKRQPEGCGNGP